MDYIISNKYLEATISSYGAELRKLIDKDGINRMHAPSEETWNRVSPILFPQISRIKNGLYKVKDKNYKMTTHGFIRDTELELVNHCESEITFKYSTSDNTLLMYPYEFIFFVTYKLINNVLEVIFKIENPSNKNLLYMLGGHPAFKVPLFENEFYSDYSIIFEKKEVTKRMFLVDGFLASKYENYFLDKINLNHKYFIDDTLIFRGLTSKYADIVSKNHDKKIRVHFSDFEILAIWSKEQENCDFICLEPWNGIQKNFVIEHENMGVLEIAPYSFSQFSYKIEVI
jgi:galactose mutarotase-like enzyme